MWLVQCLPNKDSQFWVTLSSYENKSDAMIHASRLLDECFMVIIANRNGDVIWSDGAQLMPN